ncbi:uncharacterized protein LOC135831117 [Planococcus citri]|uniref:uncharacterized protein LOC135831117 n=1 Tax=Planococcus citri TaxID=170843 RepID=UPI0031F7605F
MLPFLRNEHPFLKGNTAIKSHGHRERKLTERDYLTLLDIYFNEFDQMDTMLIESIIDKFQKIMQLCSESKTLRNLIDKKLLEKIRKSMEYYYAFNPDDERPNEPDDSVDFTLLCNHCGETFPLRNNDHQQSYEEHETSHAHIEFLVNLNRPDKDSVMPTSSSSVNNIETDQTVSHRRSVELFQDNNKQYVEEAHLKNNIFKCTICEQNFCRDEITSILHFEAKVVGNDDCTGTTCLDSTENQLESQHLTSRINNGSKRVDEGLSSSVLAAEKSAAGDECVTRNNPNGFSISVFDASCIIFINRGLMCKLCDTGFDPDERSAIKHFIERAHFEMTNLYERYGEIFKEIDDMIQCTACEYKWYGNYPSFFDHCRSKSHRKNVTRLNLQPSNIDISRRAIAKVILCPVTGCSSPMYEWKEIFEHLQSFHECNTEYQYPKGETAYCGICNCKAELQIADVLSHVKGKRHLRVVEKMAGFGEKTAKGIIRCNICYNFTCQRSKFSAHCKTRGHRQWVNYRRFLQNKKLRILH